VGLRRTQDGGEDVAGAVGKGAVLRDLERVELYDGVGLVEALPLAAQERLRHLPRKGCLHVRHARHLLQQFECRLGVTCSDANGVDVAS